MFPLNASQAIHFRKELPAELPRAPPDLCKFSAVHLHYPKITSPKRHSWRNTSPVMASALSVLTSA